MDLVVGSALFAPAVMPLVDASEHIHQRTSMSQRGPVAKESCKSWHMDLGSEARENWHPAPVGNKPGGSTGNGPRHDSCLSHYENVELIDRLVLS